MRSLLLFFAATFGVSWSLWRAGALLVGNNTTLSPFANVLFLLGTFAPGLVALVLLYREKRRAAMEEIMTRVFDGSVHWQWYVFAVLYMPVTKLLVALLYRIGFGTWPRFGEEAWYLMAFAIVISTWAQAGEEIGWRGYALPRLLHFLGYGWSSIVLGIIWALWHLPLFFVPAADKGGQSFLIYLLQVMALSVAITWLYWRTNARLLPIMVLHAAVNNTMNIVPSAVPGAKEVFGMSASPVAWLTAGILWVAALFFLVQMRRVGETCQEFCVYVDAVVICRAGDRR